MSIPLAFFLSFFLSLLVTGVYVCGLWQSMNSNTWNSQSISMADGSGSGKKVRRPYTLTKSRESWSQQEHEKFLEALQLFDRDWKRIEGFVGSKTVIQIRSHAQKYFLKVQKNGIVAHVPPPRPKRKAAHPYPQKALKNVLEPLPASVACVSSTLTPGHAAWDETSMLTNAGSNKSMPCHDELSNLHGNEADIGSKEITRISNSSIRGAGNSTMTLPVPVVPKQQKQAPVLHGLPDFAEVYSFIGSAFDPDTKGHVQKLKEMDPINFETVLLLMKNLTINLSSPDFESVRKTLSSYDVNTKTVGVTAGPDVRKQTNDLPRQTA